MNRVEGLPPTKFINELPVILEVGAILALLGDVLRTAKVDINGIAVGFDGFSGR